MADEMANAYFVGLLSSSNPFDNSKALAMLIELRAFSREYIDLASEISKKGETVAFHFPLSSIADAYLCLAGVKEESSVDEKARYLLSGYGGESPS